MSFGRTQRELLLSAYNTNSWQAVFVPWKARVDRESYLRAAHTLAEAGLLEVENRVSALFIPRRPRLCMRLTDVGRNFCEIFSTELQRGSRIRGAKFEAQMGYRLPCLKPEGFGSWLADPSLRGVNAGTEGAEA